MELRAIQSLISIALNIYVELLGTAQSLIVAILILLPDMVSHGTQSLIMVEMNTFLQVGLPVAPSLIMMEMNIYTQVGLPVALPSIMVDLKLYQQVVLPVALPSMVQPYRLVALSLEVDLKLYQQVVLPVALSLIAVALNP